MTAPDLVKPSSEADFAKSQWQYVDDDGEVQGPYPFASMVAWYQASYFTPETRCRQYVDGEVEPVPREAFQPMKAVFPLAVTSAQPTTTSSTSPDSQSAAEATCARGHVSEPRTEVSEVGQASSDECDSDDDSGIDEIDVDIAVASQPAPTPAPAPVPATPRPGEHLWHYIDDDGVIQGPFPTAMMRAWYHAGYFTHSTRVRRDDEPAMIALDQRPHTEFANTSTAIDTAPPITAPLSADDDYYYTDTANTERGPFSSAQMRHWHQRGYFTFNDTKFRRATQPRTDSATLRATMQTPLFAMSVETAALAMEQWFYLDASNNTQGPFTSSQLAQWWHANLLPKDLRVRLSHEPEFVPVSERKVPASFTQQQQSYQHQQYAQAQYQQRPSPSQAHYQSVVSAAQTTPPVFQMASTKRGVVDYRHSNGNDKRQRHG